ncbi:MAG: winged helix-turn-helix domain-containing protein [Actinomycetota bacterium]|nr:winged helix-turn-helix domain-containing protein [Actinomycetota bacterium]
MSSNRDFPDYDIVDRIVVTKPGELRAMADPLRTTILDLLLERAATVAELAAAVGRPKSTVAYHVNVLVGAGMLRVVRTRRVRAIEERFYGRTARVFFVGKVPLEEVTPPPWTNYLADAAAESMPAYHADTMFALMRHARISRQRAAEFWERVDGVIREFTQLPREGDTVYGLVAGLYPTEHPTLPPPDPEALVEASGDG